MKPEFACARPVGVGLACVLLFSCHAVGPLQAAPAFTAPFYPFPTCPSPAGFFAADVDADGRADLLVRNSAGIFFMPGLGDLTFGPVVPFTRAPWAADMTVTDVNGDDNDDLVFAGASLVVLPGDGAGGYSAPRISPATSGVREMTIADWTSDGIQDIVLRGSPSRFFRGTGDGTFVAGAPLLDTASDFVAGDFDEDGALDLVASLDYWVPPDIPPPRRIALQRGHGDGTFEPPLYTENVVGHPWRLATADFDLDGHLDLLVSSTVSSGCIVLARGDGRGGFGASVTIGDGADMAIADLDADGRPDFIADAGSAATASRFLARAGGAFEHASVRMGWAARHVRPVDLNADGILDLVGLEELHGGVVRNVVIVTPGRGNGRFGTDGIAPRTFGAGGLAVGDFSGDGRIDVAHTDESGVRVLHQVTPEAWAHQRTLRAGSPLGLVAGHLDGDRLADLAFTAWNASFVARLDVYLCAASPFTIGLPSLGWLSLADLDADGLVDILVQGDENSVVRNRGRSLGPRVVMGFRGSIRGADVDEDGHADVLTALPDSRGNRLVLRRGNGDFTFAPEETVGVAAGEVRGFEIADFDGDGHLDLAVAERAVAISRGSGDGRFEAISSFPMPYRTGALAGADFDGDGDRDLAVAMPLQRAVGILWNRGDGSFESRTEFGTHDSPATLSVADADGDGDPDLFTGNEYLGTGPADAAATVLLNQRRPPTPVFTFDVEAAEDGVLLQWSTGPDVSPATARVQRAILAEGPWTTLAPFAAAGTYRDGAAEPGTELWYRIVLCASDGTSIVLGPRRVRTLEARAATFTLHPLVVPATSGPVQFGFDIQGRTALTTLAVYDSRGARVWETTETRRAPGRYSEIWNRGRTARGVYFVRLTVDGQSVTRKLVLIER